MIRLTPDATRFRRERMRDITSLRLALVKTSGIRSRWRLVNAQFQIRHQNEAPGPACNVLPRENLCNPPRQRQSSRQAQPHQHQTVMRARRKPAEIREIQILCDQEPLGLLRTLPPTSPRFRLRMRDMICARLALVKTSGMEFFQPWLDTDSPATLKATATAPAAPLDQFGRLPSGLNSSAARSRHF